MWDFISQISAHSDGVLGTVCPSTLNTEPPIDMNSNFSPHVSVMSPLHIFRNCVTFSINNSLLDKEQTDVRP